MRAGADFGRIYRLLPEGVPRRAVSNLTQLDDRALAERLNSPNGTERDRVQLEIMRQGRGFHREPGSVTSALSELAIKAPSPAVKVQALSALHSLGALSPDHLLAALGCSNEQVRAFAIALCDDRQGGSEIEARLATLAADPSQRVRFQLASTLGYFTGEPATRALARLFEQARGPWMQAALLSAANGRAIEIAESILKRDLPIFRSLIGTALAEEASADRILKLIAAGAELGQWQIESLAALLRSRPANSPELESLIARTEQLASDSPDPEERGAALRTLAWVPGAHAEQILHRALLSGASNAVLAAAAEAITVRGDLESMYGDWPKIAPTARRAVTAAVLRRPELVPAHLRQLGQLRSLGELSLSQKQQLLKSSNREVRTEAERLFGQARADRSELFRKFAGTTPNNGSATHGAELFAKNCASCHQYRGQGFAVGPNLAALTDRSTAFLLRAILDPNDAVENRYAAYTVETKDQGSLSGIISEENASAITVLNANGFSQVVLRKEILSIQSSQLSLMPEGLAEAFSPADMADLIAFLQLTGSRPAQVTRR